ncbi:MAG: DUF2863 family protein [Candidatus Accumulibacter sp. UW26]|jgi:hypothetical protein
MKRNRFTSRKRISADATELSRLAIGLAESGSKLEDLYWQNRLGELVDRLFHDGTEDDFTNSLDRLFDTHPMAHDDLADIIEAHAESCVVSDHGQEFDILLFAAPVLAWSRFSIPTSPIPKSTLQTLRVHLGAHVLAAGARLSLADYLYSPDQLPHSFVNTWQLMRDLGTAALTGNDFRIDASAMPETNRFLSDTRYLVGALAVPRGLPIFHWNETDKSTRETVLKEWLRQGGPCLEPLLTGCAYQPLLADAYHAACRAADSASRPYSLNASVAFLQNAVGLPPENLRAVIGGFHDQRLEEYRVGFGPREADTIFHGVVWPLLGVEDDSTDIAAEIEATLRKAGLKEVVIHDQQFPYEFCDDCGAPLYPNVEGDTVHAELPEQNNTPSQTLH